LGRLLNLSTHPYKSSRLFVRGCLE
jgi:hypothetical protein